MPKTNDERVVVAARRFVQAVKDLDREGGDHAALVDKRRQELEAALGEGEGD